MTELQDQLDHIERLEKRNEELEKAIKLATKIISMFPKKERDKVLEGLVYDSYK